jgi:2OG-Fe(II) oxygenase superfamily
VNEDRTEQWPLGRSLMLEPERLRALAERFRGDYARNSPFPHAVIDEFLPAPVADEILERFPTSREIPWRRHDGEHEWKLEFTEHHAMPPVIRQFFFEANSRAFLEFLESLTGIVGLISDPYLEGGGLHQIEAGGFLDVHADFNLHSRFRLDRRLNLLLYLNKGWSDEYGGQLELWDRTMERCVRRISPSFNRCVVFATTDDALHGHPEVLRCPNGVTRKSLALYYYSNGRPVVERAVEHRTLFRRRPADRVAGRKMPEWATVKSQIRRFVPPIVYDLYAAARRPLR